MAVMATVAKGYDLDCAWRAVGEAYRGAGYYLAAAEAGSRRVCGGAQAPSGPVLRGGGEWSGSTGFALRRQGRI